MRCLRFFLFLVALGLGLSAAGFPSASAQDRPKKKTASQDGDRAPYYKKWVNEDVLYIISEEERKVFKDLKNDEEREAFIEQFWARRDPDPRSADNSFKEEHYRRIAYANERFTSGIPGWKTDRDAFISCTVRRMKRKSTRRAELTTGHSTKAAAQPRHIPSRNGGTGTLRGLGTISRSSLSIRP